MRTGSTVSVQNGRGLGNWWAFMGWKAEMNWTQMGM